MSSAADLRALLVEVETLRDTARSHNDAAKALYAEARRLGVCEGSAWSLLASAGERLASANDLAIELTVKLNEAPR